MEKPKSYILNKHDKLSLRKLIESSNDVKHNIKKMKIKY